MSTQKYTNKGVVTDVLKDTVTTNSLYSKTGTAVYGDGNQVVRLQDLGFVGDIKELWVRVDMYAGNLKNLGDIYILGDDEFVPSDGMAMLGGYGWILYYDASGQQVREVFDKTKILEKQINKIVLHVSSTTFQLFINDNIVVNKSGLKQYTNVTRVSLLPEYKISETEADNNMMSNLIIADYDCSAETLAEASSNITVNNQYDLKRIINKSVSYNFDTVRYTSTDNFINNKYDLKRVINKSVSYNFDTVRYTSKNITVNNQYDLKRVINKSVSYNFDTARKVYQSFNRFYDTKRMMQWTISTVNNSNTKIKSISINLQERTLSDSFIVETANEMNLNDVVTGNVLDYNYRFAVESISKQDLIENVQGMYDVDKLLYTELDFDNEKKTAAGYASTIAGVLGLNSNINFDDFTSNNDYRYSGTTYQDLISGLFGWTSRLPRRQINVFIRDNTLNFVQRGREQNIIDISNVPHTRKKIDKKLIRSIWNSARSDSGGNYRGLVVAPIPFSGSIGTRHYSNGLLVSEVVNGESISYTYYQDYLIDKTVHKKDGGTVRTDYYYTGTGRDVYLQEESEVTKNDRDEKVTVRETYHSALGHGKYITNVYVDEEFQGSSMSDGAPGGKASKFTIDQSNLCMGSGWSNPGGGSSGNNYYHTLIDNEFPVSDEDLLQNLTAEIEWMNRKTEESVEVDIVSKVQNKVVEYNHIVDFTERIILDGNEYYLVSNSITYNPRELRQSIKLVRWY